MRVRVQGEGLDLPRTLCLVERERESVQGGGCACEHPGGLIVLQYHTGPETHSARLRARGSAGCSFGCVEEETERERERERK